MTHKEYGLQAGLTQPRVTQLVKRGMPMDSPEAADEWRKKNVRFRAKPGANLSLPEESPAIEQEGPYRPAEASTPIDTAAAATDSPEGAYERQRQIERAAYDLAVESLRGGRADAGRLVAIRAAAAKNLTSARDEVIAQAEKERRLVSGDWVRRVKLTLILGHCDQLGAGRRQKFRRVPWGSPPPWKPSPLVQFNVRQDELGLPSRFSKSLG